MVPSMAIVSNVCRMASIAALSTATSSPRPMSRDDSSAAASVTRTRSMPRLRSIAGSVSGETIEQRGGLGDGVPQLARGALGDPALDAPRLRAVARGADAEWDWIAAVEARRTRGRVIGRHEHPPVHVEPAQALQQRPKELL